MRKNLKLPRTVEEMESRIQQAAVQLILSKRRTIDDHLVRQTLSYRFVVPHGYPEEVRIGTQQEYDRLRRKLSERVHRRFVATGKITLVCELIRQSPIFLQEQWIIDLLIDLKVKAHTHTERTERQRAIDDLTLLSEAIVEERLPSGQIRRKIKHRTLSASRRSLGLSEAALILGAYSHYLEIATCLSRFSKLVAKEWREAKSAGISRAAFAQPYANRMKVPVEWILEWKRPTVPHAWAKARTARRHKTTSRGVDRLQQRAKKRLNQYLNGRKHIAEATERLSPLRSQRAQERADRGEFWIHRRY